MAPGKRKPKDDEQSVTSESKLPVKNVPALMGEGEKFFRDQLYDKAIQCYTEALDLSPGNINALVERAACYLKIGKNDLALTDAEDSLKENKDFTKGLYQKAEALYAMGEFELALVFYHRGKKLRGDVREFQLGINKAQEAIDNCVGDPNSVKLEVKGDLSYFDKPDEKSKKKMNIGYQKPLAQKQHVVAKREKRPLKPGNQKTIKQLLGELYADKVYLENLLNDDHATRANTKAGNAIWGLANNGLDFLDSRTEFWRQQKPIYARKTARQANNSVSSKNPLTYILNQLEVIDNLQSAGKHSESLDKSNRLMIYVNKLSDTQLSDKKAITSNIHSNIGNAYLEMGKYELALQNHQKDLEISKESDNKEGISRAYENIGRVYARNGKYKNAIEVWEKKLPLAESDMEKAWLYHEIGRCHLELGDHKLAEEYGQKSLEYSQKIEDEVWTLNATILMAQAQAKMGDEENLNKSIENFEKAVDMADKQKDEAAGKAVRKALGECKEKLRKIQLGSAYEEKKEEKKDSPKQTPRSEKKNDTPTSKKSLSTNKNDSPRSKKDETPRGKNPSPNKTEDPKALIKYQVHVKTANDLSSGIDANAFISLFGTDGELKDLALKNSDAAKNTFEKGNLDRFDLSDLKDIGKLKKISIGHDSPDSGWKIDYVDVVYNNTLYKFEIDKWIDADFKKPGEKLTSVESEVTSVTEGVSLYEIEVKTSSEISAGTDGKVTLDIYGANGQVLDVELKDNLEKGDPFEMGATNRFEMALKSVGKLKKIAVNLEKKGLVLSSWKLDTININVDKLSYTFTIKSWIDKKTEFTADSEPLADSDRAEYTVATVTGNKLGAGTDSNVFINIYGDKGETGKLGLLKSNNANPFEKGKTDTFVISARNVGEIKKINISHDGKGVGAGWFVDRIEVSKSGVKKNFPVERWLDEDEGDGKTALDLQPDTKPI